MRNERDPTESLISHVRGDPAAASELLPVVYDALRRLAAKLMKNERRGHTLCPTDLVHEAYMRLIDVRQVDWKGKGHFLAVAATQMRRVLVDHAKRRGAAKRNAGECRVTLEDQLAIDPTEPLELLAIDEALARLGRRHQRQAQIAELRLFGGLGTKELAHVLEVSERTVSNDWKFARAWLARELGGKTDLEE